MALDIARLRQEYCRAGLHERDLDADPVRQFQRWFHDAVAAEIHEPNAMTLATAASDGEPSARIVLLKGCDDRGFAFFTNYESPKGQDLADNPQAALCFFWRELERQVRIVGEVERTSREESEAYYRKRPRGAQLGVWVSRQGRVVPDRAFLEDGFAAVEARFAGQEVPLPDYWGGYRLTPRIVEFWQGRPNRLHDRLRYLRVGGNWVIERLAP